MKIKLNSAKCLNCGDVLVSKYRHDFRVCSCYKDSHEKFYLWAKEYKERKGIIDRYWSARAEDTEYWDRVDQTLTGIAVDGGNDYIRRLGHPDSIEDLSEYYGEENEDDS